MEICNVLIVGMGSLGILFGQKLQNGLGREHVAFLADAARAARYRREGVLFNGEACDFRCLTPADAGEFYPDLILFAVKATALDAAMDEAAPFVGEHTILLSLLNGISSEDILAERFGREKLLYCVAQGMDATKLGNELRCTHPGQICLGAPPADGDKSALIAAVCALFDRCGIAYTVEADILRRLWSKFMLNVGVNQVVMVFEGTYATVQAPGPARDMMRDAMREVITLANASGVGLTEADLEGYFALMDTLSPEGMPSMRQDGLLGRPTEVELFSGTVLRLARPLGLDLPVNRYLYRRIREMEADYLKK